MFSIGSVMQWLGLLEQVVAGGSKVWADIKGVLESNGIQADTDALDIVIADAARRKALAAAEAGK